MFETKVPVPLECQEVSIANLVTLTFGSVSVKM